MRGSKGKKMWECVLVDLNTQRDFLGDDGSCLIADRDVLVPALRKVIAWAKWNHVPVISAIDSHRECEPTHDGFPAHCVDGRPGQQKIGYSLFGSRIRVEGDNTLAVPLDLFHRYQQVIFRKRSHDLFGNPKADRFLTQLPVQEFILFGVGLEYSIRSLTLGLLAREKRVTLISDACGYWNSSEGDLAIRLALAKGANIVKVDQLLERRTRRVARYPLRSTSNASQNGRAALAKKNGSANGSASRGSTASRPAIRQPLGEEYNDVPAAVRVRRA